MAKFTSYYKIVEPIPDSSTMPDNQELADYGVYGNYTWYQRLVQGAASRLTRYREYDLMDNDVEVARALDAIAEEMTGNVTKSDESILIDIEAEGPENTDSTTVMTLKAALKYWTKIHRWDIKLFTTARLLVKYGDVFFRKSKSSKKWEYVHAKNVVAALVDSDNVTKILGWQIKTDAKKAKGGPYSLPIQGAATGYDVSATEMVVASEIVRFTLNDDMTDTAPFGESVLRSVYRAQKQKELLEDAIIIYRVQRAPERRVFYIDVGKMPPMRIKQYLETIKNEIKQKRIPSFSGGQNEVDTVYNPHSMVEDFFLAQRCLRINTLVPLLDGRSITLEQIIDEYKQGKKNFVYSIDQKTSKLIPGEIEWAGITRKNAQLIRVWLDSGQYIDCTPDHKFVMQDGSEIEAEFLKKNAILMPHFEDSRKVQSVEMLPNLEDTGCLTIKDPGENHNFALSAGIYVKNSDGKGSRIETLPGGCLDLFTEINLLDGRTLTLMKLIEEYQQGKQNWAYSVNPSTGEFVPGVISWAGVTREAAEVYEVMLDNGKKIICTPDHKFPVWGKGTVQTKDLQPDDSIIQFNLQTAKIGKREYTQIYDHSIKKLVFVHRKV
ncbi:MAG: portal protein, partial [Nitrosopumilaceae archaeon]